MSHYDCKNCGHSFGISWGMCEACTPPEYVDLGREIKKIKESAKDAWGVHSEISRKKFMDEWQNENGYQEKTARHEEIRTEHLTKKD